jgi:hypothetical protein
VSFVSEFSHSFNDYSCLCDTSPGLPASSRFLKNFLKSFHFVFLFTPLSRITRAFTSRDGTNFIFFEPRQHMVAMPAMTTTTKKKHFNQPNQTSNNLQSAKRVIIILQQCCVDACCDTHAERSSTLHRQQAQHTARKRFPTFWRWTALHARNIVSRLWTRRSSQRHLQTFFFLKRESNV